MPEITPSGTEEQEEEEEEASSLHPEICTAGGPTVLVEVEPGGHSEVAERVVVAEQLTVERADVEIPSQLRVLTQLEASSAQE